MLKSIACGLVLVASLPATTLAAQPVAKSEIVRFHDLDLASPAGVAALERRINSAARRVCSYYDGRGLSRIVSKEVSDCLNDALASARKDVALKTGTAIRKG
jgi:UrcA family protein